eukprot:6095983-Alexandrium_andersonii.AAC.1
MSASLVGSEMCIRDSPCRGACRTQGPWPIAPQRHPGQACQFPAAKRGKPVSYTHLTLPTICSV